MKRYRHEPAFMVVDADGDFAPYSEVEALQLRLAALERKDAEAMALLRDMRSGRSSLLVTFFDRIDAIKGAP